MSKLLDAIREADRIAAFQSHEFVDRPPSYDRPKAGVSLKPYGPAVDGTAYDARIWYEQFNWHWWASVVIGVGLLVLAGLWATQ